MSTHPVRTIIWIPRALGLLFVAFISLFALDVFGEGAALKDVLVGLFMHLIPSFLILIGIFVAWKRPVVGGLALMGLGAVALGFYGTEAAPVVAVPLAVLGVLFVLSGFYIGKAAPANS